MAAPSLACRVFGRPALLLSLAAVAVAPRPLTSSRGTREGLAALFVQLYARVHTSFYRVSCYIFRVIFRAQLETKQYLLYLSNEPLFFSELASAALELPKKSRSAVPCGALARLRLSRSLFAKKHI